MRRSSGEQTIAVAYLRVSTEDQRLGPEAQRAAIEQWAGREGVQLVAWHCDQGVSGATEMEDRHGLAAALAALRPLRAGVLVVAKRDRLARDVVVAGLIDRAVARAGARVVAADGAGNGTSPADALMRTILDGAAEYERAIIRQRTRAALQAKRARGERAGELPFGFRLGADGQHLEQDPGEQAVIEQVHTLRAAGLSLRAVVAALAEAGAVGRTGRPLILSQVARLARRAA